jgi:hypothetical protein
MMIWVIYKNELIKAYKRFAVWVTFLFFSFFVFMEYGSKYFEARGNPDSYFGLPDEWPDILASDGQIQSIFAAVLVILLVAAEFQWRTSRQNVIDGLSKDQWFVGKLLLVPSVLVLFYGSRIGFAGFLAFLGTDPAASTEPMLSATWFVAVASVSIGVLIYISLAFLLAMAVRNAGPAMGLFFVYMLLEQLIMGILMRFNFETVAKLVPFNVAGAFFGWIQYDPVAFDAAVQRAVDAERTPPEIWDPALLYSAGLGWIAVFLVGSYLWYRKMDL